MYYSIDQHIEDHFSAMRLETPSAFDPTSKAPDPDKDFEAWMKWCEQLMAYTDKLIKELES